MTACCPEKCDIRVRHNQKAAWQAQRTKEKVRHNVTKWLLKALVNKALRGIFRRVKMSAY